MTTVADFPLPSSDEMSSVKRRELAALMRRRERVAKTDAKQLAKERRADVEAKLATEFAAADERWAVMVAKAQVKVAEANEAIREIVVAAGFPPQFAPSLQMHWQNRGENHDPQRRAELRRVAQTRIEALLEAANAEIEKKSVAAQETLLAGGLSAAAAAALIEMPSIEELLP